MFKFRKNKVTLFKGISVTRKDVPLYVTSDGMEFEEHASANNHEAHLTFKGIGVENKLWSEHLYNSENIVKYLYVNRDKVDKVLAALDAWDVRKEAKEKLNEER